MARDDADWGAIRRAYEGGEGTVADICKTFGVSAPSLYRQVRDRGWTPRSSQTLRHSKPKAAEPDLTPSERMLNRLHDALERQMADVEARLSRHDAEGVSETAAERDARTLSSLVRTFERLLELQDTHAPAPTTSDKGDADDTMENLDIDAFREELARRLEDLQRTRKDD